MMTRNNDITPGDNAVIVFLKTPEKGAVKTRLAETVGDDAALDLYKCFVADVLDMLKATGRTLRIYYHPAGDRKQVRAWLGDGPDIFPQSGDTLGEKMKTALAETFSAGFKQAVVIGSDLPDLPPEVIDEAFDWLQGYRAVIGPSRDGGYYLIGFTTDGFAPNVFDDIPWGTAAVLGHTLERFGNRGITPRLLPVWRDIDTVEDLKTLSLLLRDTPGIAVHTAKYLRQQGRQRETL